MRLAIRALRKTPAFSAGAVITIALAIGATTAIFSVVQAVLLRQLPYRDPARVLWIWSDQPGRDRTPFNVPDFIDYRDSTRTLSGFAGFFGYSANLSDESAAERVQGIRATGNFFAVLGAEPRLGRLLAPDDDRPDAAPAVVLTEPFWIRRFGADPDVVGRSIRLNGEPHVVVGVIASGFATPVRDIDVVVPYAADRDARRGERNSVNFIIGVGRLASGVSPQQAEAELNGTARRLQQRFPVENARKRGVRMVTLVDGIAGPFRTALFSLLGAVAAVLLIACANLANLMLARATGRRKELAVQMALGSSKAAIARQVLAEAFIIGMSGGTAGVVLAAWGIPLLMALAPPDLPRAAEVRVDVTVLMFSIAAALSTSVLFGIAPALASADVDIREALQGSARGSTAGGGQRVRGVLVSAEVALSLVLVVMMAMLARSFANVQAVAPGFDPSHVLSVRLTLPAKRFADRESIVTFQRTLLQRFSALPSVTGAGAITLLPLSGLLSRVPFTVEGRPLERDRVPLAQFRTVSPGYFEAARIPVQRGRTFSERDTDRTRAVAVVNAALARQWLEGLDPIGTRLLIDDSNGPPRPVEIVGVVGDVRQISLDGPPTWDIYLTYSQVHPDTVSAAAANMFWIVRTVGDPMAAASVVAGEVRRIDPEIAASQLKPLASYLSDAAAPRRFSLLLMGVFACAALVLAATGIYAVVTYSANQRAREIGIRIALGATPFAVVRLVIGQALRSAAAGIAIGILVASVVVRLVSSLWFEITPSDPPTFAAAIAAVAALSLAACVWPALQLRGDPSLLRGE